MNQTTRTYPRTMEQAFGPYHRGGIYEEVQRMDKSDKIVLAGCAVSILAIAVLIYMGVF